LQDDVQSSIMFLEAVGKHNDVIQIHQTIFPIRMEFIARWKVAGTFVNPNGILLNWKWPSGVENAVFSLDSSATSILANILATGLDV
jgi:hypothetical protein